jgi:phage gp29-like protein
MEKGLWVDPNTYVKLSSLDSSLSEEIATRERSMDFYGLGMFLPNPDPVLRNNGQDIRIYRELAYDAHVRSCIKSRKSGVRKLLWDIDRGTTKSKISNFIFDLLSQRLSVHRLINTIINAPLYGYQPLEINWAYENGYFIPAEVKGKPPEWFQFGQNGELLFISRGNLQGEPVPAEKFIVAVQDEAYENPYGIADLSACFWPLTFKKGGLKYWVTFTEKFGMPWPVGKYAPGTSEPQKKEMLDMLERMVQDGIAIIPSNAQLEFMELKGGSANSDIYEKLVQFCNSEISKALLGQTLTTEINGTGSYAASQTHNAVRQDIIDDDKALVCETIQKIIDRTVGFNFGDAERPQFSMYAEEDVDLTLSERDKNLTDGGRVKLKKPYYMRAYGLKEDEVDVSDAVQATPGAVQFSSEISARPGSGQAAIDELGGAFSQETQNDMMEKYLEPVISMIEKADSLEDVKKKLPEMYSKLDSDALRMVFEKALLLSTAMGKAEEITSE